MSDAMASRQAKNQITGLSQVDYTVKMEKTTDNSLWDQILGFHK